MLIYAPISSYILSKILFGVILLMVIKNNRELIV